MGVVDLAFNDDRLLWSRGASESVVPVRFNELWALDANSELVSWNRGAWVADVSKGA